MGRDGDLYRMKRSGSRIDPWGTAEDAWHGEERAPVMTTSENDWQGKMQTTE